jgi:eukaryotic-like serine/threonine-protein kinase
MAQKQQTYGRYILEDRIAMGGMAEIFRARTNTEGFQKQICIKRILPNFVNEPGFEAMFRDEAALAANLQHANIVQVFDFGEVEGTLYLAMEFIDGVDLKGLLDDAKTLGLMPSVSQCCQIAADMCRGLHYAHNINVGGSKLGIVHRDISPHNVLVSRSGEIKVADFGIAKAAERLTQTATGMVKGKVAYMAPEQANDDALDHRVDQFATGVVLWEMITGQKLFARDRQAQTLMAVLEAQVPPPSTLRAGVPAELDDIVLQALAKSPEDRFENMRVFQQSLGRFIHSLPPQLSDDDIVSWVERIFEARTPVARNTQILPEHQVAPTDHALSSMATAIQPKRRDATEPTLTLASAKDAELTVQAELVAPRVQESSLATVQKSKMPFKLVSLGVLIGLGMYMAFSGEQIQKTQNKIETVPVVVEKKVLPAKKVVHKKEETVKREAPQKAATQMIKKTSVPKAKQVKGAILIDIVQSWAEVWWQGKKLGETPTKILLPVGTQEVLLKNPETKQQKRVRLNISAEDNKAIRVRF